MAVKVVEYARAAEVLGISIGTLYEWVSRKKIPHIRLGPRLVRFDEDELTAWLQAKRVAERKPPESRP